MRQQHFEQLKLALAPILKDPVLVEKYEKGLFIRADKVKDLQKRFCYDVLYTSRFDQSAFAYLDDNHIYTALKSICPKVVRRY